MTQPNPILFYDGVCNLCSSVVRFIIKFEKNNCMRFCPLQSELAKNYLSKDQLQELNTVYVYDPVSNKIFSKSGAAFFTMNYLKAPWSYAKIFRILPRFITDIFYDLVAKFRYQLFGKKDFCETPDRQISHRFLS